MCVHSVNKTGIWSTTHTMPQFRDRCGFMALKIVYPLATVRRQKRPIKAWAIHTAYSSKARSIIMHSCSLWLSSILVLALSNLRGIWHQGGCCCPGLYSLQCSQARLSMVNLSIMNYCSWAYQKVTHCLQWLDRQRHKDRIETDRGRQEKFELLSLMHRMSSRD